MSTIRSAIDLPQKVECPLFRSKRRFLRFSLRALLVFVVLASVGMAWVAAKMQQARQQREVVESIKKLGGGVRYDYHDGVCDPKEHPPVPAWLLAVFGDDFFAKVVGVGFFGTDISDDDLAVLEKLPHLEFVQLERVPITDEGLNHLKGLRNLRSLSLTQTGVTWKGITELLTDLPDCKLHLGDGGPPRS
jgi:hypothetical protein